MTTIRKRSYGIIPIAFPAAGGPLFLILRAYSKWDFPKGGPEAGETPRRLYAQGSPPDEGLATEAITARGAKG